MGVRALKMGEIQSVRGRTINMRCKQKKADDKERSILGVKRKKGGYVQKWELRS